MWIFSTGAVELIVLSIAFEAGIFMSTDKESLIIAHLFSALVFMVMATTFLTLLIRRRVLPRLLT